AAHQRREAFDRQVADAVARIAALPGRVAHKPRTRLAMIAALLAAVGAAAFFWWPRPLPPREPVPVLKMETQLRSLPPE
ncbi:MAG TPA: hypothetical protein VFU92_09860, partial [Usitatibacter sp.]|nr:hypothetical protein [Usitatibacter sp.]